MTLAFGDIVGDETWRGLLEAVGMADGTRWRTKSSAAEITQAAAVSHSHTGLRV
jgi:hypothetical protein